MRFNKTYYIYLLANHDNRLLYVGVTSNLSQRVHQHKSKHYIGYTSKHNISKLVYFEAFKYVNDAIKREKQIKSYRREKKDRLINLKNPAWDELIPP